MTQDQRDKRITALLLEGKFKQLSWTDTSGNEHPYYKYTCEDSGGDIEISRSTSSPWTAHSSYKGNSLKEEHLADLYAMVSALNAQPS